MDELMFCATFNTLAGTAGTLAGTGYLSILFMPAGSAPPNIAFTTRNGRPPSSNPFILAMAAVAEDSSSNSMYLCSTKEERDKSGQRLMFKVCFYIETHLPTMSSPKSMRGLDRANRR